MFDTFLSFIKMASEQGLNILSIMIFCIAITFITLTGFIVFVFVAKTVWTSLFGGTKSSEPIQYALLKRFLLPILMNGGKDLGKTIMDTLESKEAAKSKESKPKKSKQ
jgi:hypothetical protein